MRIAVSGTHRTGKSTLIEELSRLFPKYKVVEEPYHLMVEDEHEFSHPPAFEDYEAQLERSIEELSDDAGDVLFDRCPVDLLAYLMAHPDGDALDLEDWLPRIRDALGTLDLVVFVPIETPDRIEFAAADDPDDSRAAVDERLRELLLEDSLELGLEVVEVSGGLDQRVAAARRRIR